VHAIGLSPAVSGPMLDARIGSGPARRMLESGEPVDGASAHAMGLLHALAPDADALEVMADAASASLLSKGPRALAATKRWLTNLDRSIDAAAGGGALAASMASIGSAESRDMLRRAWDARRRG
jgi:methylglutaconyl-CoA hydratase